MVPCVRPSRRHHRRRRRRAAARRANHRDCTERLRRSAPRRTNGRLDSQHPRASHRWRLDEQRHAHALRPAGAGSVAGGGRTVPAAEGRALEGTRNPSAEGHLRYADIPDDSHSRRQCRRRRRRPRVPRARRRLRDACRPGAGSLRAAPARAGGAARDGCVARPSRGRTCARVAAGRRGRNDRCRARRHVESPVHSVTQPAGRRESGASRSLDRLARARCRGRRDGAHADGSRVAADCAFHACEAGRGPAGRAERNRVGCLSADPANAAGAARRGDDRRPHRRRVVRSRGQSWIRAWSRLRRRAHRVRHDRHHCPERLRVHQEAERLGHIRPGGSDANAR